MMFLTTVFAVLLTFMSVPADTIVCETTPSFIDFSGEATSPIDVMIFVSSNCPSCREAVVILNELSNTAYRGKIKVSIKPLYRMLGDIASIAANKQSKSWDLYRAYSNSNNRITADNINDFFAEAGIDKDRIYEDMRDSTFIFSILKANYAEAIKCGMRYTPHILFNGIVYDGNIKAQDIVEFIDDILTKTR